MRNAYLTKNSVKRSPLRPTEIILEDEFVSLVEKSDKLIWLEQTKHGIHWNEIKSVKKKRTAYLNYNPKDEKSFVQLSYSKFGYITVQFDYKSTKTSLHDLIDLALGIGCILWQYSPKRQILTHEIVNDRHKRTKPRTANQSILNPLTNWIYCEGSFEKFGIYNRIKFDKINATIARVNKGSSKNSVLGIEIDEDKFCIIGDGIFNLFDKETKLKSGDDFESLKSRFRKRISKLFSNVIFNDSEEECVSDISVKITEHLVEVIRNQEEVYIAMVNKKLF